MTCAVLHTNFALPGNRIFSVTLVPSSYNLLELAEVTFQKTQICKICVVGWENPSCGEMFTYSTIYSSEKYKHLFHEL